MTFKIRKSRNKHAQYIKNALTFTHYHPRNKHCFVRYQKLIPEINIALLDIKNSIKAQVNLTL